MSGKIMENRIAKLFAKGTAKSRAKGNGKSSANGDAKADASNLIWHSAQGFITGVNNGRQKSSTNRTKKHVQTE